MDDAAIKLGMDVFGYDPEITVDAAWSLPSQVRKAHSIEEVLRASDFVTLHVTLLDATRNLIDAKRISLMKPGAVLLNFSRDGIVDNNAVLDALNAKKLRAYVCDFPGGRFKGHPAVVATPHLGASTLEAEENCAIMVVDQVRDYLENGNIRNAVNFPEVVMNRHVVVNDQNPVRGWQSGFVHKLDSDCFAADSSVAGLDASGSSRTNVAPRPVPSGAGPFGSSDP